MHDVTESFGSTSTSWVVSCPGLASSQCTNSCNDNHYEHSVTSLPLHSVHMTHGGTTSHMKSPPGFASDISPKLWDKLCETNPARQTLRDKPCETNPPYVNKSSRRGWTWQLWWYHSIQNNIESFPWYLQQSNYTRKSDTWDIPVIPKTVELLAVWDLVKPRTHKCFFYKTDKLE